MAVARAFQPLRMDALGVTFGDVLEASQSRIVIAAGPAASIYGGSFQYDSFGNVFGTLSSFESRFNNVTAVRVDQFSINANDAFRAIQILEDGQLFAELILASNDTIFGSSGADFLFAHTGSDFLDGGDGDDVLHGDSGNDTLQGGNGSDTLIGGTGIDTAIINATFASAAIIESEGSVIISNQDGTTDEFQGIERFAFSDQVVLAEDLIADPVVPDAIFNGSQAPEVILGTVGNDSMVAGGGDDTLAGDAGNDVLDGGLAMTGLPPRTVMTLYRAALAMTASAVVWEMIRSTAGMGMTSSAVVLAQIPLRAVLAMTWLQVVLTMTPCPAATAMTACLAALEAI